MCELDTQLSFLFPKSFFGNLIDFLNLKTSLFNIFLTFWV